MNVKQIDEMVASLDTGEGTGAARLRDRARLRWPLMPGLPLLLVVGGGARVLLGDGYVSTDDAFIRAPQYLDTVQLSVALGGHANAAFERTAADRREQSMSDQASISRVVHD
jgi:hypothetical protein